MRSVRNRAVILLAAALAAAAVPAAAYERAYVAWDEFQKPGADHYFGVRAAWSDNDWDNIPCPNSGENKVNTFVNAYNLDFTGWVQTGYKQRKIADGSGDCDSRKDYYWEFQVSYPPNYDRKYFDTRSGPTLHLVRRHDNTGGTACENPDVSWCWQFLVDNDIKNTCCGDRSEFEYSPLVSLEIECGDQNDNEQCPASGEQNTLDNFQYRIGDGSWTDWGGRDGDCADFARGMKGRWSSDMSGRGAANSPSFQNTHSTPC